MGWSRRNASALLVLILASWVAGYGKDVMLIQSGATLRPNCSIRNGNHIFFFTKFVNEHYDGGTYTGFVVEVRGLNGKRTFNRASDGADNMVLKMQVDGNLCLGNDKSNVACFVDGIKGGSLYLQEDGGLVVK